MEFLTAIPAVAGLAQGAAGQRNALKQQQQQSLAQSIGQIGGADPGGQQMHPLEMLWQQIQQGGL